MASPKSGRLAAALLEHSRAPGTLIRKPHAMTHDPIAQAGFAARGRTRVRGRRGRVVAQLITSVALVLSIAVAATAVSIGIAHADGIAAGTGKQNARLAVGP
jgi:hypothetical protein